MADGEASEVTLTLQCRICGKRVSLNSAKTDADGGAVHDECLSAREINAARDGRDGHAKSRPWTVIAAEVEKEHDPKKMTELVKELNEALDQQIDGMPKPKPDGKP